MRWKRRRHRRHARKLRKLTSDPEFVSILIKFRQVMNNSKDLLQDMVDRARDFDNDIEAFTVELEATRIHES